VALIFGQIKKDFDNLCKRFGDLERSNLGSFHNPVYYDILRSIYDDKEERYKIKLSDFYFIRK
jgi:3-hydroxy-3-methylglutaryl CoA synthase